MTRIYTSFVALGDSLSEGLGDTLVKPNQTFGGWADRLALLLAQECREHQLNFDYANFALRGSKTNTIMVKQADQAIQAKPDLITVMAGANDMLAGSRKLLEVEHAMRRGLMKLTESGAKVVLVNLADPNHTLLSKSIRKPVKAMTQLINRMGAEFSLTVVDLHSDSDFSNLEFWSDDFAHFSTAGHIRVTNLVAKAIGLKHRWPESEIRELAKPSQSVKALGKLLVNEGFPLILRRMQNRTSGDHLSPKMTQVQRFDGYPLVTLERIAEKQKLPQSSKA